METRSVVPRGCANSSYFIMTPDNACDNHLPHLERTIVHVLAAPRNYPARFGQYLLQIEPSGGSAQPLGAGFENFLYQLEGDLVVETAGSSYGMQPGSFCFFPSGVEFSIAVQDTGPARTLWTKRYYESIEGVSPPAAVCGHVDEVEAKAEAGAVGEYRCKDLLPVDDAAYDMAMNVNILEPGSSIGMLEVHHQEHGIYLLEGRGVYYIAGDWHELSEGDYLYIAPYCPQSFWSTGTSTSAYLLYKDVNRDGFPMMR